MGCVSSSPKKGQPGAQTTAPGAKAVAGGDGNIQSSYYAALDKAKALFDTIDANADGTISKAEWQEALRNGNKELPNLLQTAGFTPDHMALDQIDTNKDGRITWDEYQAALVSGMPQEASKESEVISSYYAALEKLKTLFDVIDANADGSISEVEWRRALAEKQNNELVTLLQAAGFNDVHNVMERMDRNKDGRVSWEEFKAALCTHEDSKAPVPISWAPFSSPYYAALDKLRAIFDKIDANADGTISKMEWQDALAAHDNVELSTLIQIAGLSPDYSSMEHIDTNKDGRLTWNEFEAALINPARETQARIAEEVNDVKIEDVAQTTTCCLRCM